MIWVWIAGQLGDTRNLASSERRATKVFFGFIRIRFRALFWQSGWGAVCQRCLLWNLFFGVPEVAQNSGEQFRLWCNYILYPQPISPDVSGQIAPESSRHLSQVDNRSALDFIIRWPNPSLPQNYAQWSGHSRSHWNHCGLGGPYPQDLSSSPDAVTRPVKRHLFYSASDNGIHFESFWSRRLDIGEHQLLWIITLPIFGSQYRRTFVVL